MVSEDDIGLWFSREDLTRTDGNKIIANFWRSQAGTACVNSTETGSIDRSQVIAQDLAGKCDNGYQLLAWVVRGSLNKI